MLEYFYSGGDAFLLGMGIDPELMPVRKEWKHDILSDHAKLDIERNRIYVGWHYREELVGHCSVNKIRPGKDAFLHLHLWRPELRRSGLGRHFVRLCALYLWDRLQLKLIYSEPYAENPGPNRTFARLGFTFVRRYRTVPGIICFEQDVNRWELRDRAKLVDASLNHCSAASVPPDLSET